MPFLARPDLAIFVDHFAPMPAVRAVVSFFKILHLKTEMSQQIGAARDFMFLVIHFLPHSGVSPPAPERQRNSITPPP
jgi:hypothetical protein